MTNDNTEQAMRECLEMIRDWPVNHWQDWQLATRTMAAMAKKVLERAAAEGEIE